MEAICERAFEKELSVLLDAEEVAFQGYIDELALKMMERYNQKRVVIYNTFQMYRWDALERLEAADQFCKEKELFLGVKLVRGAYMKKERALAKKKKRRSPIHVNKEACDMDFNRALEYCIGDHERIGLFVATHNQASINHLKGLLEKFNIPKDHPHVYFSQLYGMGDNITYTLAAEGYHATKFVPYGPVEKVVPYLYRRMQENCSMQGQSSRELQMICAELKRRKKK